MIKPINDYPKLTIEESAYLAGLIDGDGAIRIRKVSDRKRQRYQPSVYFCNTNKEVIDWIRIKLKNTGSLKENIPSKNSHLRWWRIEWVTAQARNVIEQILPYLIVRKNNAIRAIELSKYQFDPIKQEELLQLCKTGSGHKQLNQFGRI